MWKKQIKSGMTCWNTDTDSIYALSTIEGLNSDHCMYSDKYMYYDDTSKQEPLPAGVYRLMDIGHRYYLVELKIDNLESILEFSTISDILKDIHVFLGAKSVYNSLRLKYKRGIFLYGPPGTGKTSLINKVIKELTTKTADSKDLNAVIIFASEALPTQFSTVLKTDPRLKLIIFEEFTNVLNHGEVNADMLDFLDGEASLDNCFIIGSSNYPEKLPMNITQRPGRFDKFYRVDTMQQQDVIKYLEHFGITISIKDSMNFLGKTIAELKELILIHKRDGKTLIQALEQITNKQELSAVRFKHSTRDDDDYIL